MSVNEITAHPGGGMTFAGPKGVDVYRATVLASALRLYAKTGMKPNSAYTPSNMLRAAGEMTGAIYKRGQYEAAAAALTALSAKLREEISAEGK